MSQQFADEIPVGVSYDLGSHHVTESEMVGFALQWDPQHFHVDAQSAARSPFGGLIGSGVHSMAIYQRLAVRALFSRWHVIAGRRIDEIELTAPTRPGDVLTGTAEVVDAVEGPRRSLVVVYGRLTNQSGTQVMSARMEIYVARAPGSGPNTRPE